MANNRNPSGEQAHTFPPRAQRVARGSNSGEWFDRRNARGEMRVPAGLGDLTLRVHPALSFFAASLIAALPVHAFAQDIERNVSVRDRARPDFDPLGLRFGAFQLDASVDFSATQTDNLFATETNEQSDLFFTVAPRARLASTWSRHEVAFEAGGATSSHQDFSSEDATTSYVGAQGRLDIGRDSLLRVGARHSQEIEPRTDPDALIANAPVEFTRTAYWGEAQHTFNRLRLRGRLESVEYDYDDVGALDQDFRDATDHIASVRGDFEVAPRVGILLQAIADERDYHNAPTQGSEGRTYLAGVSINFTDLMYGELSVGQYERDYNFGRSFDGVAVAGHLEWYITQLTTLNFHANRSVQDAGGTVGSPYVQTEYSARIDHELQRNLILTAGVAAGQHDYEVLNRTDDYVRADTGVDYLLNRRVVLFGRYRFDSLESDGADRYRDFDVNAFTLGVRLRL